jgi:hypothetical protein
METVYRLATALQSLKLERIRWGMYTRGIPTTLTKLVLGSYSPECGVDGWDWKALTNLRSLRLHCEHDLFSDLPGCIRACTRLQRLSFCGWDQFDDEEELDDDEELDDLPSLPDEAEDGAFYQFVPDDDGPNNNYDYSDRYDTDGAGRHKFLRALPKHVTTVQFKSDTYTRYDDDNGWILDDDVLYTRKKIDASDRGERPRPRGKWQRVS